MVSQQTNRNKTKQTKYKQSKSKKFRRARTILLLPGIVILGFMGHCFHWIDNRNQAKKGKNKNQENMQFDVLLPEEKYVE